MLQKIFSVYDSKAESYIPPFYCPTSAVAIRNFTQAANEEGHSFNAHAEDYCLFELGTFDDQTAVFVLHKAPFSLGLAQHFIPGRPGTLEAVQS